MTRESTLRLLRSHQGDIDAADARIALVGGQSMGSALIIGAGAAGAVATKKCAMNRDVFERVHLASRTLEKCQRIQRECVGPVAISQVDADDVGQVVRLIESVGPDIVINVALPYQDLPIMDACLEAGVHYLDTANYEPRDVAKFEYKWQWAYQERSRRRAHGAARLGLRSRRDQRVLRVRAEAPVRRDPHVDIVDCNAGSHGKAFATNFNPEINIREVTPTRRYWENGEWMETDPLRVVSRCSTSPGSARRRLPHLSRGARVARPEHQGPEADPLLDDVRRRVPQAPRGARRTSA